MVTTVKGSSWTSKDNIKCINILDVGALADGVTDCSSAIVTALNTGYPVYIPPLTFMCSPFTIPVGAMLFGEGEASILKALAGVSMPVITISSGVMLQDFSVDGNASNQSASGVHGIQLVSGIKSILARLFISNTLGDGINITGNGTSDIDIVYCRISSFGKSGITVENGSLVTITAPTCHDSFNTASPGDGISLAPLTSDVLVARCTVLGGKIYNNKGRGLSIVGFGTSNVINCSVQGTQITQNGSHGLHLYNATQIVVNGLLSYNNTLDGIRLENATTKCRVGMSVCDTNGGFGIREIAGMSTPNYNGLIYDQAVNNGNNTITKVGANSFIV